MNRRALLMAVWGKAWVSRGEHEAACETGLDVLLDKCGITHSHRKPCHTGSASLWAKLKGDVVSAKETSLHSTGWTGPEDFLGIPEP